MKVRGIVTFSVMIVAAAVGMAMSSSIKATAWQPAGQSRQAAPDNRPPGPPQGAPGDWRGAIGDWFGGPGRRGGGPGGPGGPGGMMGRMLFRLDLTAEQQEQVKTLMQAEREATQPYQQTLRDVHDQLRQATQSGEFNEAAVRALAEKEAAATIELRVLGAKTQAAIYNLLTAEQKKALAGSGDGQAMARPRRGRSGLSNGTSFGTGASALLKGGA